MPAPDPTLRFSNRVEDYVRFRPGYPEEAIAALASGTRVGPRSAVADVGSGTGKSAEPFLRLGCTVYGVEPNREMRLAAERLLAPYRGFHSVDGTAEATGLPDASADLVVAAQAFHWFRPEPARREFARILRPGGWVALLWNSRRTEGSPFLRAYEALLRRFGTDYAEVDHRRVDAAALRAFFGGDCRSLSFPHEQRLDVEGLRGRLLSSSYAPAAGHPDHAPMLRELEGIFAEHQTDGQVSFEYDAELHFARLASPRADPSP